MSCRLHVVVVVVVRFIVPLIYLCDSRDCDFIVNLNLIHVSCVIFRAYRRLSFRYRNGSCCVEGADWGGGWGVGGLITVVTLIMRKLVDG